MSTLQFGYENRFRERTLWHTQWLQCFPRPVSPMARLHFLVALRSLKNLLPIHESGCILEAGARYGHLSFWLARFHPYHVVALDLDSELVIENQQVVEQLGLKNLSFIQRDLTRPLNLAQRFDLVLCFHVLEHIEADVTALKHLYDVTAPGGYLVILVPGGLNAVLCSHPERLKVWGHVRPGYTLTDLRQKAVEAGFQVVSGEIAVGTWGIWACRLNFNLCVVAKSFLLKGIGWVLASILAFLEYWFPIRPRWDVLLVAQKTPVSSCVEGKAVESLDY